MASLRKRKGVYYIVFTRRENGKLRQKAFSLNTTRKSSAEKFKVKYTEAYALGEIDPFSGWTHKLKMERARASLHGSIRSSVPSNKSNAPTSDRATEARC